MKIKEFQFFKKLTKINAIDAIWLYGSRARKDAHERSDIDLAIICPLATDKDWQKILTIIEEADTLLKVDCIRFDTLDNHELLKKNILRDKIILFEKSVMSNNSLKSEILKNLGEALNRLKESIEAPIDPHRFVIDAAIQRFEFSIELFWKVFKILLEAEGKEILSPRQAISQAFQMKWFANETLWLNMLRDRNLTSHTYKKIKADEIYQNIKLYYPEMQKIYNDLLKKHFSKN